MQRMVIMFVFFLVFLLMIRIVHKVHIRETYADVTDMSVTSQTSNSMLDATTVEPDYIEVTDTIYVTPDVPVETITCEPKNDSFDKINVNEISTHTDNANVQFTNNVNINGTLEVKGTIKMNDKVLFNYDEDSKTLRI